MDEKYLWWKHGVVYQIYPRSFADGNNDGLGDLAGITSKLDYLQELGIDAIWLSPINPSPDVDFGYDVSDFRDIDPKFGSMQDFELLLAEAHARGIHVMLDMVFNHTSDQHEWFKRSRSSRDDYYHDWYLWQEGVDGKAPNNWASWFGGDGWEYDPRLEKYYFHMFYKQQPDLNWRNPDVRKEILDTLDFWLAKGVDGFRLDVFNVYFKDADFTSNPARLGLRSFDRQIHIHDFDQPEMFPLLYDFRQVLDKYDERYMVGEPFMSSPAKSAAYMGEDLLHAAFNFRLLEKPWQAELIRNVILQWEAALSSDLWPTWVLNNHDNKRSATRYNVREDDTLLKAAAVLLLTLHGTPYLYYGEEIGMRDIPVAYRDIQDPIGKRYWPIYKGRDGCRAPMQWDAGRNAGFSDVKPWLPPHADHVTRNVAAQTADESSLFNHYKRLLALRRSVPALHRGGFEFVAGDASTLAYKRTTEMEEALVVINFAAQPKLIALPEVLPDDGYQLVLSSLQREDSRAGSAVHLDALEARIYLKEKL